ncbi:uncharacterized protein LOC144146462 [Haemaphysalis longicornis]
MAFYVRRRMERAIRRRTTTISDKPTTNITISDQDLTNNSSEIPSAVENTTSSERTSLAEAHDPIVATTGSVNITSTIASRQPLLLLNETMVDLHSPHLITTPDDHFLWNNKTSDQKKLNNG